MPGDAEPYSISRQDNRACHIEAQTSNRCALNGRGAEASKILVQQEMNLPVPVISKSTKMRRSRVVGRHSKPLGFDAAATEEAVAGAKTVCGPKWEMRVGTTVVPIGC